MSTVTGDLGGHNLRYVYQMKSMAKLLSLMQLTHQKDRMSSNAMLWGKEGRDWGLSNSSVLLCRIPVNVLF